MSYFDKIFQKDTPDVEAVQNMLDSHVMDGVPIKDYVTKFDYKNGVLDLSLRLPNHIDMQKQYDTLCQIMHDIGVHKVNVSAQVYKNVQPKKVAPHPRIRSILAVASGKGGVGKSTTSVNIALALQQCGYRVGILDADIYGPSIPDMLGVANQTVQSVDGQFMPIEAHNLAMLSIGSLLDDKSSPIAWRGIKATGALMQLYHAMWPNLDYLIVDLPPGTGDIALTMVQKIPITAAIIVTTPQHVALLDAQKGMELFFKTNTPVLGVVENMAFYECPNCYHHAHIFGEDGGQNLAKRYKIPLLGKLPLIESIRKNADRGTPSVLADDIAAPYYKTIAQNIITHITPLLPKKDSARIF